MNALSLGIIGGADGPTAILVTSAVSTEFVLLAVIVAVALVIGAVLFIKSRKNK